ncbi:22K [Polar bear adenovirus 1]|nr:22K [Polar bear adenovirus 1]
METKTEYNADSDSMDEDSRDSPVMESRIQSTAQRPARSKAQTVHRRWDQKEKQRGKSYHSWRKHKSAILLCLTESNGDISFARRYMLFKKGVLLPRNIIHYYNSHRS